MDFKQLTIPDVVLVAPKRFSDTRGWFAEIYNSAQFEQAGIRSVFVQDNHSYSARNYTIRGLHFQHYPHAQAKLVRVVRGSIFDVAVDLRRDSSTYGRHISAVLTSGSGHQIFIPKGFAHGFCTLDDGTEVVYKVDAPYAPEFEGGLLWNDPDLAIEWPVSAQQVLVSEKDAALPKFSDFHTPFLS